MKCATTIVRNGYDKKTCLVHARCCEYNNIMIATAQPLDVDGDDKFSGILLSTSNDSGKTWTEFVPQKGLEPLVEGEIITVGSDGTPIHHKKTDTVLIIGHTVEYQEGELEPRADRNRYTFYSVYDKEKNEFKKMRFLEHPGHTFSGSGCGQYVELENGDLLVPVYYKAAGRRDSEVVVLRCSFDGEELKMLEQGTPLSMSIDRGLGEPSVIFHDGVYYLTIRNDECGVVAKSTDGLNYTDMQLWKWEDGSILQNYNTQQHFMTVGGELYLVYTRRGADNDHVFRHRAPLFAARVENMRLVRDSEFMVVPERGARLGNFCAGTLYDGRGFVMAAEWMQPKDCDRYGSDNSVYYTVVEK